MSHKKLQDLVHARAGEREIQRLLKDNLNLLGEAYTPMSIQGEYIVFSEYPILAGKTDFVVFTDRSRMVIVVIEVKGADFNFLNFDGTANADIYAAAQQISSRFQAIESSYEAFRRGFHDIRLLVEGGNSVYNSFLGPTKYLHVDPHKDVWLRGAVIGGRMGDSYADSRVRHALEKEMPRISFDSWDSWLENNKRRRR